MPDPTFDLNAAHRWFAVNCFNQAWDYINKSERTQEDDEEMIRLSLASTWHWTKRPDCTNVNRSISLWQNSRVYALAGQPDNARRYGQMCLDVSQNSDLPPFYLGYAYEALARAERMGGDPQVVKALVIEARRLAEQVTEEEDRSLLLADLDTI
jgi:hypothetical protein